MWCAFPAGADPIAIEAHCMGFGVPAPSSLRKNLEEALTIMPLVWPGPLETG